MGWQPLAGGLSYRKACKCRNDILKWREDRSPDDYLVVDEKTWTTYLELMKEIDSL